MVHNDKSLPPKIRIQFLIVPLVKTAENPTNATIKIDATAVPIMAPRTPPCPSPTIDAPPHSKKLVITRGTVRYQMH